jgi:NADH:ubiquinone oxidoreductase subunit H
MMPMRSDRDSRGWLAGSRARWSGLSLLSKILLVLSAIASLAVVVIMLFVVYLFIGGYSGGNNPTSIAPVLFPIAFFLFVFAGVPSMLVCCLLWIGYAISRYRDTRRGEPVRSAGSAR